MFDAPIADGPVRRLSLHRLVGAVVLVFMTTAGAAQAPDPPPTPVVPQSPQPPAPPGPVQTYDGVVRLYLVDEYGDVEGVIAEDGTQVRFPPHMGPDLVRALKPGDRFTAQGDGVVGRAFRAYALGRTGTTLLLESRPTTAPAPRDARITSLVEIDVDGTVATLLHGPRGELDGVVLVDGTIVRLPRRALADPDRLHAGSRFAAHGYGSRNTYGRSLRAERIGIDGQPMVSLQPRGPEGKAPPRPRAP